MTTAGKDTRAATVVHTDTGIGLDTGTACEGVGRRPTDAVNPARWPDVAHLPPGGLRAAVARRLFERVVARLAVQVQLPGGRLIGGGDTRAPLMRLHRPDHFYRRLGAGGLIGFGESYLALDWDADDLTALLTVFATRMATLVPPPLQRLRELYVQHHPGSERGTVANSAANVSRHYDLSNELFALFLDPSMTYSAALFEAGPRGEPLADAQNLRAAQHRKIDRLLDALQVTAGTRLLEIGTGWGELALRAGQRGAQVRSVTLSEQQRELALQRVQAAGLADRVSIDLCDYRAVTGSYDAVVSVEMIEAVGFEFWPEFFATVDRLVRPGGRAGLQAITMPHDRMLASRQTYTWIHKYVFPGGLLPSVESIEHNVRHDTGMVIEDRFDMGAHYAQTLRLWRETFQARSAEVDRLGFDATFRRMWRFYLAYSEAGFASRYLDVNQFVLRKPARP